MLLLLASWPLQTAAQQLHPPTNLEVMRVLVDSLASESAGVIPRGASVAVVLRPDEVVWYLEPALRGVMGGRDLTRPLDSADVTAEYGVTDLRVEYIEPRRDGLFGDRLMTRRVTAALSVRIVRRVDGGVLYAGEGRRAAVDTVLVEDQERLENPTIALTRAPAPGEGFFTSLLEPLVLIGALAVGVYLLFTVRS
jgi:hypothetical protein